MNIPLIHFINAQLFNRGFYLSEIRQLIIIQLILSALLFSGGLCALFFNSWLFWLGLAALLSTFNFLIIAKSSQNILNHASQTKIVNPNTVLLFFKIIAISLILFALIIFFKAKVIPLLIGFSLPIFVVLIYFIIRMATKRENMTMQELEIEDKLLEKLKDLKYTYRKDISDKQSLEAGYKAMAYGTEYEQEAMQWCNALTKDFNKEVKNETTTENLL